ncbi:MAG: hypothetical protein ACK53L_16025, partial [Pirellulaceae bacterium]
MTARVPLGRFARLKALLPAGVNRMLAALVMKGLLLGGLPPAADAEPARRIGVWLTNSPSPLYYDGARIDRAVTELAGAGFTTLYPN